MLEPWNRATLTSLMQPPVGYQLSQAVGTTFTLDLVSALLVPMSLASHREVTLDDPGELVYQDPLSLIDAVGRMADRIDIFAQAGQLSMRGNSRIITLMEPSIHPVTTRGGLFHPKVWFLEFAAEDDPSDRCYRFICASRNLTADRSWDVVVSLDGTAGKRSRELSTVNAPLLKLLKALPDLAVIPLPKERGQRIRALADRMRYVHWETPPGMHSLAFHVLGLQRGVTPDLRGAQALVISPFLSDDGLALLFADIRNGKHLMSRPESIDLLQPHSLPDAVQTYCLDEGADLAVDLPTDSDEPGHDYLVGLHAKAIVIDRGNRAHVFLGSANATDAAWHRNVEVMVELVGSRQTVGVDKTLEALGGIKDPYSFTGTRAPDADDEARRALEAHVREIAKSQIMARVDLGHPYRMSLWSEEPLPARDGVTLSWGLLTRPDVRKGALGSSAEDPAVIDRLQLHDVSPFLVLNATDAAGSRCSTVVLAQLLNDVPDRRESVIAHYLTDSSTFIRLLLLMLASPGSSELMVESFSGPDAVSQPDRLGLMGLFETLARAVGGANGGLKDVQRVIKYLEKHSSGAEVLPEGFADLWRSVWQAHQSLIKQESLAKQERTE